MGVLTKSCRQAVPARRQPAGFTMIELLIAILILLVGIVAVADLVPTAIRSNLRNRGDSTGLIVAQRFLEVMATQAVTVCQVTQPCPPNDFHFIDTDGNWVSMGRPPVPPTRNLALGCILTTAAQAPLPAGVCDFSQPPTAGYSRMYTYFSPFEIDPATGQPRQYVFDVRWHVNTLAATVGGTDRVVAKVITVSVRSVAARALQPVTQVPPATVRQLVSWR